MLEFRTHILRDQRHSLVNDSIPMDRLEGALEHLGLSGVASAELAINATSFGQNATASTLVHTASVSLPNFVLQRITPNSSRIWTWLRIHPRAKEARQGIQEGLGAASSSPSCFLRRRP
jgi:hypothetical protein